MVPGVFSQHSVQEPVEEDLRIAMSIYNIFKYILSHCIVGHVVLRSEKYRNNLRSCVKRRSSTFYNLRTF